MSPDTFHHIVVYRLRAGVTLDRVRSVRDDLAALVETLPGVRDFIVTDNVSPDAQGYKLALIATFDDRRAYEIFTRHPESKRILEALENEVTEDRLVIQGAAGDPARGFGEA